VVAAFNRPGGNITGISLLSVSTEAKRLQLLHEMVPHAVDIGVLVNANNPQAREQSETIRAAAHTLGINIQVANAGNASEIDSAFAALKADLANALIVAGDAFFNTRKEQLVALSAQNAIPTMYVYRHFPAIGGLMSYGPNLADAYRQAGIYAGRILRGEKLADLPIQQVVKFDLVINLKTAKALGLTVPLPLLGRADEVIE
jgi:putative ABC transport system substrate-binding protein